MATKNTIKDLKVTNRQIIYDCIKNSKEPLLSCAKIARQTGISLPTVIKVAGHFADNGILFNFEADDNAQNLSEPAHVGRPPVLLKFNPNAFYALGAAYDGKYLNIALLNLLYETVFLHKLRVRTPIWELLNESFSDEIEQFLKTKGISEKQLIGIGIALPVIIDTKNYKTLFPAPLINLFDVYDFSRIFSKISMRFDCPAFVENDVNTAAIGAFKESRISLGNDLVYITVGNGIGSGMILGGRLRRGANYSAGEIGYMSCGETGYLEERLSPQYLLEHFGYNAFDDKYNGENGHSAELEVQIRVADHISKYLSQCIRNVVALLDINYFVIGGFIIEPLKELIFKYTKEKLNRFELNKINLVYPSSPHIAAKGIGAHVIDKTIQSKMEDKK